MARRGLHPFWQAVALLLGSFLLFKYGIPLLPGSAPVPNSVIVQYTGIALVGILIYVSTDEARWRAFKAPIRDTLVSPERRMLRGTLLVLFPLAVGYGAFQQTRPKVGAVVQLRSLHPAPPGRITFRGRNMELAGLENPLRDDGRFEEHRQRGHDIYYRNCLPCHGDLLDGNGHFAHGFNPTPLAFDQAGTIDMLQESYLFWRIAKGGPGLPREGAPWNSAMPVWEDYLSADDIWSVILFLYDQAGLEPRTWEVAGEGS